MTKLGTTVARGALPALAWLAFSATTWNVYEDGSGDAPTIQAAMDSASMGDTVLVWPGTYPGLVFVPGGVHLLSQAGPEQTTLTPGDGRILLAGSSHFSVSLLRGFTMTGSDPGYGNMSSVSVGLGHLIEDCVFREIKPRGCGSVLDCIRSTVRNCTFENNETNLCNKSSAGVRCRGVTLIENCVFSGNYGRTGRFFVASTPAWR